MNANNKINSDGFSLVELVVVVAVLSILASIAIPFFGGITRRARQSVAASHVDALLKAATIYKIKNGRFPNTWEQVAETYSDGYMEDVYETCAVYNSQCNGNEKAIVNGQYIIAFWAENEKFGISVSRFNNVGPTSQNMHVMGCASSKVGSAIYLFKEGSYYQGKPWNRGILDNDYNEMDLCQDFS